MLAGLFAAAEEYSAERERQVSRSELEARVALLPQLGNPYQTLAKADHIKVIAEIKRASPSRGNLAAIENPAALAVDYEESGASAISVLTERTGFLGSMEDLIAVSSSVTIPALRKDFISNEYQILDARASGAALVLLILAHLSVEEFERLHAFAMSLGLGVLTECHNQGEIENAAAAGAKLIGINTRDLVTFKTDLGLFEKLSGLLPQSSIRVAESSVRSADDVRRYRDSGADVVLVGEALVTGDHKRLIREFVSIS